MNEEHIITTFIRTKQFWQHRLKDKNPGSPIFVSYNELKPFTKRPQRMLEELTLKGELTAVNSMSMNGNILTLYKATNKGAINPLLLKKDDNPGLSPTAKAMRENLKRITLVDGKKSTPYFDVFLKFKDHLELFFTVDDFSGRVHTPVTSFKSEYRKNILIDGEPTISIDVATMQPLLLGKVLSQEIGENEFSAWINKGDDIYIHLMKKLSLKDRETAKIKFFELTFSKPDDSLRETFGQSSWINWINDFKKMYHDANPHSKEKPHSNLAWLLQKVEVSIMSKAWKELVTNEIPFLTVHDEIILKTKDHEKGLGIMNKVLSHHLTYFKLNIKH
jgi:hypothetical protein